MIRFPPALVPAISQGSGELLCGTEASYTDEAIACDLCRDDREEGRLQQ